MPAWLPIAATALGALGSLFGGGGESKQRQEIIQQLSPEQRALLSQLQGELEREDVFDVSEILRTTRERFGAEVSGSRQAALQRLMRSGVTGVQRESVLADVATPIFREMGSTLASLEFGEQTAEEQRRLALLKQMSGLLSGQGRQVGTTTTTAPSGLGFAQLFGAGLQGLMSPPGNVNVYQGTYPGEGWA